MDFTLTFREFVSCVYWKICIFGPFCTLLVNDIYLKMLVFMQLVE